MSIKITYKVKSNQSGDEIMDKLFNFKTKMMICDDYARLIDPWVPYREGVLSQATIVGVNRDGGYVEYIMPYAHYMYMGEIYGPNIPIKQKDGTIEWRSPKGKKKTPTGRPINYVKDGHPLATSHWDKVAMQTQMDKFKRDIANIVEENKRSDD